MGEQHRRPFHGAVGRRTSVRERRHGWHPCEDAVRDAIRRSLDSRYINKPRQIDGEVVLWDDPIILVRSGAYSTSAKVKLLVRELVPYRIF